MRNGQRAIVMRGWIVTYASMIHVVWGIILWLEPAAMDIGPIHRVADWLGENNRLCALLYLAIGMMGWVGSCKFRSHVMGMILGIPQLFLIFMGMESCLEIVFEGEHPDGTTNERLFFLAQLAGSILLGPVYMLAVYGPYWKVLWRTRKTSSSSHS